MGCWDPRHRLPTPSLAVSSEKHLVQQLIARAFHTLSPARL